VTWTSTYGSPFTVEVYATYTGYADSPVATASYTVSLNAPTWDGKIYTAAGVVDAAVYWAYYPPTALNFNGRHKLGINLGSYTPATGTRTLYYTLTANATGTTPTTSSSSVTAASSGATILDNSLYSGGSTYTLEVSEYVTGWGLSPPFIVYYTNSGSL